MGRQPGHVVCALNFANGVRVGGGYKTGAVAQEEDLCRRLPSLYSSLLQAERQGLYPFGPGTCASRREPRRYSDVLYTPDLVVARTGQEGGFALLPPSEQASGALVTAAAPNVNFAKELYDLDLMYDTVRTAFLAPRLAQPETTTLVLGAWGCGAFGGNPHEISELFARALLSEDLRRLYREVHFAIPTYAAGDVNARVFKETLLRNGIELRETPARGGCGGCLFSACAHPLGGCGGRVDPGVAEGTQQQSAGESGEAYGAMDAVQRARV